MAKEFAEHFSAELILVYVVFQGSIVPGIAEAGFHMPAAMKAMHETAEKTMSDFKQ